MSLAGHNPWGRIEFGTTNTTNQLYSIKTNYKLVLSHLSMADIFNSPTDVTF